VASRDLGLPVRLAFITLGKHHCLTSEEKRAAHFILSKTGRGVKTSVLGSSFILLN